MIFWVYIFCFLTTFFCCCRYVITELMQSDLHKIIVSPQHLSTDHIKVFLYQILRGKNFHHFHFVFFNTCQTRCKFQLLMVIFFFGCLDRIEVSAFGEDSPPWHQTREPVGQQQLLAQSAYIHSNTKRSTLLMALLQKSNCVTFLSRFIFDKTPCYDCHFFFWKFVFF